MAKTGAQLVVECLESLGVDRIFGIPGAKIDAVFNALVDSPIRLIVCRHEQNAAFMAAVYGRHTGKPGVVLVTSGPGVSNLATGLLTATTEGDPIIAIGGNVPRSMLLTSSHQNCNNVKVLEGVTKSAVELYSVDDIPQAFANAHRVSMAPHAGACFISLPQDILAETTKRSPITPLYDIQYNVASTERIQLAADLINQAKLPVLFLGQEASRPENTATIRELLRKVALPTISTYQAAGVVSRELVQHFIGRVGLFKNQVGDQILSKADVVICVGFNPVEYDPIVWNVKHDKKIIHIDYVPAPIYSEYAPTVELLGDVSKSVKALIDRLHPSISAAQSKQVACAHDQLIKQIDAGKLIDTKPIHPLRFIAELRDHIDDETIVSCDIGSVYMWIARYFLSYHPHHLLFSNGQQTLGVGMPWALSSSLLYPDKKIVSISGDGGFLFSAMEMETAVREGARFVHFIWKDESYNMVAEQELLKYKRTSGVDFGGINVPDFAESFGARGYDLENPDDFGELFKEAQAQEVPVLINVPIDYSHNMKLFTDVHDHVVK